MVADSTTQHDAPSPGAPQQRAMLVPKYTYTGPVDHTIPTDRSRAAGKSVIVTGGANGMGEACVRDFVRAGAFVTIADSDDARGRELERELNDAAADGREVCVFVKVDVRDWDQVKAVFETARTRSPSRSVDVVLANAGISRNSGDSLWTLHDPNDEVAKPDLNIVNVNLVGTLYTWKLAVHYFRKQPESADRDRCFIITGSMVAYIDSPANWEYTATKYGLLGFMKTARRSSWEQGIRINYVAPCYIRSAIRSAEYEKSLMEKGVVFGEQEDVAACMMRIACDRSIDGRSLMIVPRSMAKEGFMDTDREDFRDTEKDAYFKQTQEAQLVIIQDRWRDDYVVPKYK
ncbi:hypothetical protein ACKVWC_008583 [Pyricularia oryzae]|nr:hypothetical protein MCOR20_000640 [Pyricularia oryzae]KAI6499851.1 hypothetical protein MCOR11_003191 [Pyricularia oryzae]